MQTVEALQQPVVFTGRKFKIFGTVLGLLAAATLSLGVANVFLTWTAYCSPWNDDSPAYCSNINEPYIWTWVASGIWASVPILLAGLFAMCITSDPAQWVRTRCFSLFILLSAIVFCPGMIVLSSMEVWRGHEATNNFYKLDSGLTAGNIPATGIPYQVKFFLPLVIAILGGVMFIMTGIITLILCCCMERIGIYPPPDSFTPGTSNPSVDKDLYTSAPPPPIIVGQQLFYPRPQVKGGQISAYGGSPSGSIIAPRYSNSLDPYGTGKTCGQLPPSSSEFLQSQPPLEFWM